MKATIFNNFKVRSAESFRESFDTDNVYLWLGGPTSWDDENDPPQYEPIIESEIDARANIILLAKLTTDDGILAIPRYDWTLGEVYDQYADDDAELFTKQFFVMTSANNVYKCISNNDGAASTNVPIGTSTSTLILADGYQWKFMYNLSIAVSTKFLITEYVPTPFDLANKTSFE